MARSKIVLAVVLLSGLVMSGTANAYYFDIWPATADGSMDQHPSEGYAISGEGNMRFTKSYHHMTFLGFGPVPAAITGSADSGYSDGPDGIPQGRQKAGVNDKADGVLMADWLVGKKAFHATVYVRDAGASTCDPYAAAGTYQNSPVTILGFRVANDGPFVDRGTDATGAYKAGGYGGCCADYTNALLDGGENGPVAWRMGRPAATGNKYSQTGDIGLAGAGVTPEWYKASMVDTLHAGQEVKIGTTAGFFGTTGFGGFSTNSGIAGSGHFAFDYLAEKSDAMMINSATLGESDCTGYAGEEEPRDFAADLNYGEGWYAKVVDRGIIEALVTPNADTGIIECKGLVFSSASVALYLNPSIFGRDQGGGQNGAYLAITATLAGDGLNNDGCVDVVDLLDLVGAFGSATGDVNFSSEVDWNSDGYIDVVDLLTLVESFGLCAE